MFQSFSDLYDDVSFQLKKIKKRKQVSVSLVSNTFYAIDIFIKNYVLSLMWQKLKMDIIKEQMKLLKVSCKEK